METRTRTPKTPAGAALALLTVVALVVVPATPAGAHSELESATPADGARVTEPVGRIDLVFASALLPESIEAVVIVDGAPADVAVAVADDTRFVTLEPAEPMTTGDVGVAVRAVADDGHTVEVSVGFRVDSACGSPDHVPPDHCATHHSGNHDDVDHQPDDHRGTDHDGG